MRQVVMKLGRIEDRLEPVIVSIMTGQTRPEGKLGCQVALVG